MSSSHAIPRHPVALVLYGVAVLLAIFEIAVFWMALNPSAVPDYRAYYIDKTTTCLNQPRPGTYTMGERVSFTSEGYGPGADIRVCGWEGPAGDGTHSVGETSRLRFATGPQKRALQLNLEMQAVERPGHPSQRVVVSANGMALGEPVIKGGSQRKLAFCVPPDLVGENGKLDVFLDFPDAIRMSPGDSDARKRAIKLRSASVTLSPKPGNCQSLGS